jgi:hypothetical protein
MPVHELGHYLSATWLGARIVNVRWFNWPWDIFDSPQVEVLTPLSGFGSNIFRISGLGLSLVVIGLTIIVLKILCDNPSCGVVLVPLCFVIAVNDLMLGDLLSLIYLVFSSFLFIHLFSNLIRRNKLSISLSNSNRIS